MSEKDSTLYLPRARDLLYLSDPIQAVNMRWAIGRKIYEGDSFEEGNTDRDPLLESYEEMLDLIGYLNEDIRSNQWGRVTVLRNELIYLANHLRDLCRERLGSEWPARSHRNDGVQLRSSQALTVEDPKDIDDT